MCIKWNELMLAKALWGSAPCPQALRSSAWLDSQHEYRSERNRKQLKTGLVSGWHSEISGLSDASPLFKYIYLKGSYWERERRFPSTGSLFRWPQWPGLGPAKAKALELCLGDGQGHGHPLLLSQAYYQGAGVEVEWPDLNEFPFGMPAL